MSDYTPVNDFSAKDSLTTGDPEKIILGSDVDNETAAIQTAVATKFDVSNWATLGASLGNGSIADIAAFTDANADVIFGWDDSASAAIQFTLGGALDTSGTVLQVTAANILTQLLTVDGSGSTLDADLLDGQDGAYYLAAANITGSIADARLSANVPLLNASNTFTADQLIQTASNATLTLNTTAATDTYLTLKTNSSTRAFVGVPGATNGLITGSAVGDLLLRVQSGGLLFSGDAGTTAHLKLSSAGVVTTPNASAAEVGYKGIPFNNQDNVNYTTVLADAGKTIYAATAGKTITINGALAYPDGTTITIVNLSGGTISIAMSTDNMYLSGTGFATSGTRTLASGSVATAIQANSSNWLINGVGLS